MKAAANGSERMGATHRTDRRASQAAAVTDTGLSPSFAGRKREIRGAERAALDDAMAGHGRLVMLVGEPGIGKLPTAQEPAIIAANFRLANAGSICRMAGGGA